MKKKVINFFYVVFENRKIVIESEDERFAKAYADTFDGKYYTYFPYADYGYEDPYSFLEEWKLWDSNGNVISYRWDGDILQEEVSE